MSLKRKSPSRSRFPTTTFSTASKALLLIAILGVFHHMTPGVDASLFGSENKRVLDKKKEVGDAASSTEELQRKDRVMLLNDDGETAQEARRNFGGADDYLEGGQISSSSSEEAEDREDSSREERMGDMGGMSERSNTPTNPTPVQAELRRDDNDLIDRLPHSKSEPSEYGRAPRASTLPPPPVESPLPEFTREQINPGALDPKAEGLYNAAVEVLVTKQRGRWGSSSDSYGVQRDLRTAYMDLEEAAQLGHTDAEKLLAFSYLFGDYRWSIDEARSVFEKLAAKGSPDAHLALGFLHSTGVGVRETNTARGLLHYTFAAIGGNPLAQMALGYRYGHGIHAEQSCETALMWYKRVAKKVANKVKLTGTASIQRIRIPDELEATQGAASSATSGALLDGNVLSYYKYLAETGDMQAMLGLAQLYLTGGKGVPLDSELAAKFFKIASEAGNAQANGYLGRMYLEGSPSTPQSNTTALEYFKKSADKGSSIGQCGLGMMYLYGFGTKADPNRAFKLLSMAADQGLADAQLHIGQMHFQGLGVPRDFKQALKYFQLASQSGNLLAVYNLAQMHAKGTGVMRSCKTAMALYKNVAERGKWAERFMDAYMRWSRGAVDEAALRYLFLAELGYEVAQTNFAWLMDAERSQLFTHRDEIYQRALLAWQRAANQDYALARVKLGDYKYYGLGTTVDMAEAANHYQIAVTSHQNPQAMFNLGYMHECGLGVNRDLHLAKRYYDMAAETSSDAFVPVTLSLMKLRMEFTIDYLLAHLALRQPWLFHWTTNTSGWTMEGLGGGTWSSAPETMLGPDWDIYVMTALCGFIALLVYRYLRRNRQPTGGNGGGNNRTPRGNDPAMRGTNGAANGVDQPRAGAGDEAAGEGAGHG